jgi:hypothetical protein
MPRCRNAVKVENLMMMMMMMITRKEGAKVDGDDALGSASM